MAGAAARHQPFLPGDHLRTDIERAAGGIRRDRAFCLCGVAGVGARPSNGAGFSDLGV